MKNIHKNLSRDLSGISEFISFEIYDLDTSIPGESHKGSPDIRHHRIVGLKNMGRSFCHAADNKDNWSRVVFDILQELTVFCSEPLKDRSEDTLDSCRSMIAKLTSLALPNGSHQMPILFHSN